MMRRSRISVKPNFRPGNRTGTEGEQASQRASVAGDTLLTVDAEELAKPAPSQQQNVTLKEPPDDVGLKETPEMPSKSNQHDGAPSSGAATSTPAPHRRMRISATPKLLGPKFSSTPRSRPSARMPSSVQSPLPNKEHVQIYDSVPEAQDSVSLISSELSESGTPGNSKSASELPTQSCTMTQLSSLCIPSTSGLQKAPFHGKKSVEDSPPSPQPGQVPHQPPQEPESPECPSTSDLFSASTKLSCSNKAGSSELTEKSSDKDQILRALKLKELMKIERRKDIMKEKRKVGYKTYTVLDRSKMTMRDLIYYLPNTSPMRSSVVHEENPAESNIPPSPKEQIKTADEEEEEEDDEFENEDMLVPKVRVAEDGSIILDEESLTVRIQRTSDTKVVENSAALFERGSTTTYASFRAVNHVKSWSVRETDLFFLAVSMVGTDFSLIGQLLTNRSRAAIKSKFKKEERVNSWRVDKALRNKRPFDKEFFSYLLEKVLAKDKDKRKTIKLVLPKSKKPRRSKGKTSKEICVDDDDLEDLEDDGAVTVEKESQKVSNVKEADVTVLSKKRCKRRRDKDNSTEEEVKRKRQRKCSKKTREDDTEGEQNLNVEGDVINVNEVDELESSTSASKRRRKRSKGNENEKPVKEIKHKRNKKSLKESLSQHEESSVDNEEDSAIPQKKKRVKNSDLDGNEPVKGKKTTKRKKAPKMFSFGTVEEEGTAEGGDASAGLQEAEQLNATVTAEVADNASLKGTRRSKKPLPKLARARSKKTNEPQASAEVQNENPNEKIHESILTAASSPLQDERLQMEAVVVLEKTPPRHQYLLSPSKDNGTNNELEPSMRSPSSSESSSTTQTRMGRARKVKRDLSTIRKAGKRKETMARDEPEPENPMVLLEAITRESEDEEDDYTLNENLMDMSCLRDLDSQTFQRKPMVVLSREEVDKILHASEQSDEEDPSVSPLDLSLNTELSFPLQCSKILEDNEEAVVDCMFEEHEERTNESISSEAENCKELEPALVQPDISNLRDISTSIKPEVCSQPEVGLSNITISCPVEQAEPQVHPMAHKDVTTAAAVLDLPPPLVVLDNVDPLCMKTDEAVATTVDTSVVVLDVKEKSEKAMLPSLLKEPRLASSKITAQSKLTSLGRGSGSPRPLQADTEVKGEFQMSLKGPSQTLETLKDSSASKEDTQEPAMARPKIKAGTQSGAVALEVKEDSQKEVSVQSSASISSEHGIKPTRRSKFLKPKPNLSQKSRATVLQNQRQHHKSPSTLNSESSEPNFTEKVLYSPANDQHHSLENFSKQNLFKEKETSWSNATDRMESDSAEDLSATVPDQENNTTVNLSLTSADEPQVASECSKSDADMIPPSTSPPPSQTREHTSVGQMIVPSENICVPAEIVHLSEESHNDEEPTFILTLYEIPVTETYLPSAINDSEMNSDLPTAKTQSFLGFSDQAQSLPSTSESSRIDPLQAQNNLDVLTKGLTDNGKEQISADASHIISQHMKEEDSVVSANQEIYTPKIHPHSECKMSSEFALLDLAPSNRSSGFSGLKCITTLPQDSTDTGAHMQMADDFLPVSEDKRDKDRIVAVEKRLQSKEATLASVTEHFAKTTKEEISPYEPILLDTKDEEGDAWGNLETGIPIKECKIGSEFAPLDLTSRTQNTSSGFNISTRITALQDSDDNEQCERVSCVMLGDVFVPVSEETGNDTSKDGEMAGECMPESYEASTVGVTEYLAQNDEEQISKPLTSHEPIFMETKNEDSDAGVDVETGNPHLDTHTESKHGSEIAPIDVLASSTNSIPSGLNILTGITSHQDFEDSERVPHVLLADVFVPASEKTGDDSSKDWTMAVECKEDSRQDLPYEELTKVGNSPGGSDPLLCFDSTEEAKDTPPLSEKSTTPARRRKVKPQPKLVKRACSKSAFSKTDEVAKELRQPNSTTHAVLPASHEENLPGNSNTSTEESGKKISSIRRNKTSASRVKGVKHKSIADESPKISKDNLVPTEKNPSALHLSKEQEREQSSSEGAKVQPCCEDVHFNLMKSSGSASSTVDSKETEAESQGVSHMVLDDVFVLVSDETDANLSNDWRVPIESTQEAGTHFQKELKTKNESQTSIEETTQSLSKLEENKTPVRKRADKQEVTRKCTENDSTKTSLSQPTSSQARTPSAQVPSVPQKDNMLLLEEKLQRKHNIMPCTIKLSSLDTVAQSLNAPQLGDMTRSDKSIGISSPTCHASGTTVSEESSTPELDKKSPSSRKGKKKESSTDTKHCHLKPVQPVSQTQQLTITDWVKKKSTKINQTAKQQEEKQPMESSHMQSGLKANEEQQFLVEKTCSKSQHKDLEKPEGSDLVPTLEDTEDVNRVSTEIQDVKRLSEMVKDLTKDPTVSQMKNSPVRRRAKLQVKPILSKKSCIKNEGNTSTSDQPQPTRFTSPTRQHARAARKKEEYDDKKKQSVEELTNTSSMETNSMVKESFLITSGPDSPNSNDIWPRVVLPRVKLRTTEEGTYSTSSTCTSSLARLSQCASPPVTPPQLKKSPTQSSSPTASENLDDDPSRVSQFFLCDIFTEVEESE
ncbi:transcription factor TFIIIB component B'' homolog isoform X2 [Tachysurus fulvidraco]|uniref:transcription factor TFIIIB component B'' homolog isoform X2 n=1 Tax=Tachysurus fulvidraco TaxID=1234273 RepID=UPI001FED6A05|nr:transcription factor TFIIIB component B'' homolog isoform X2 [Tachysurus fulvidraco]